MEGGRERKGRRVVGGQRNEEGRRDEGKIKRNGEEQVIRKGMK